MKLKSLIKVLILSIILISCSSDDNDDTPPNADSFAVGIGCAGRVTRCTARAYTMSKKSLSLARRVLCESS